MSEDSRRTPSPQAAKRRASKAVVVAPAAPQGLPALFERAASAANFDVDALTKLMAIKREIEADAERRAFDQDFAALQAELSPVEANAFDPQKHRAYADINALLDVVAPAAAAKGFGLSYDTAPGGIDGTVKVTVKLMRNGIERTASVDMPLDGHGMRGGVNMSAPQAYASTLTHGRKAALTLMFNLNVAGGGAAPQKAAEPPPSLFSERQPETPPWDAPPRSDDDLLTVLKRAAAKSRQPATDKQIPWLADLMRKRGERPEAVLEDDGSLSSKAAGQAIDARRGGR